MCDEEVAFAITKKLRLFAFSKCDGKMVFDCLFAGQQALSYQLDSLACWLNAKGLANALVYCAWRPLTVDHRSAAACSFQFGEERLTLELIEALLNDEEIWPETHLSQSTRRRVKMFGGPRTRSCDLDFAIARRSVGYKRVEKFLRRSW